MRQLVILNLGKGTCQTGFPTVALQVWQADAPMPMQFTGALPPAPELAALHRQWQRFYQARYDRLNRWAAPVARGAIDPTDSFEMDEDDITVVSQAAFDRLCQALRHCLNEWLLTPPFRNIDQKLRTLLSPIDEIRVVVMAESAPLRLPWHLWQFLDDYPQSELALSPAEAARSIQAVSTRSKKVRILVILGNAEGLDLDRDVSLLRQLPQSELTILVEPSRADLSQQLWGAGWDILFFAGHSSSAGQGQLFISNETLTIEQLKYGLRTAISQGLKLAIFNSCDGLGLAEDLADLHLPQVIVMREAVPDRVAQTFLQHFLTAFSSGESLYGAVRQAREKLQDLEPEFPCASWLPVICQNSAEVPPTWWDWCNPPAPPYLKRRDLKTLLLGSLAITALLTAVRWLGLLQPLELAAFDRLMQLRPIELPDDRLLVVTVTEADIQAQGQQPRLGSLSDRTLHQLLQTLESYQPQAIGLDLYRDFPARLPALNTQMQSDRLIGICKRPDPKDDPTGILPPPEISADRLGFSDFVQDPDGAVRRQLLVMSSNPTSPCTTPYAFSVQLAFRYLNAKGITPQFTAAGDLQFGNTIFHRLQSRTGGYQPLDAGGSQILLNYRAAPQAFQQVPITQILNRQINANAVKNKIVLIGLATPSSGDAWVTPYGRGFSQKLPGVMVHAQMVSQILSTVLDRRPLLWVWQMKGESLWIGSWAVLGSLLGWTLRRFGLVGSIACAAVLLFALCWGLLLQGGWIPLIPPLGSLLLSSVVLHFYRQNLHHE